MVSLWERGNSVKGHSHFWCQRNYILLLPSSVDKKIRFVQLPIRTATGLCQEIWCEKLYRGWRWQDDVSNGGFQLVDGGSALMSAIVWLNRLDFYMELPGFVFVLWVAGWIEGIIFGMWKKRVKETKTTGQCETKHQRISTKAFKFADLKTANSNDQKKQQIEMNLRMSWKLGLLNTNRIMENKKDIYVIHFWSNAEALCINLWNVLKKTEKVSNNLIDCCAELLKKSESTHKHFYFMGLLAKCFHVAVVFISWSNNRLLSNYLGIKKGHYLYH